MTPKSFQVSLPEWHVNLTAPLRLSPEWWRESGDPCLPGPLVFCLPTYIPRAPLSCPFLSADLLAQEAQLVVTIGNVRGVPDTSLLDPEPGPEGPFITYTYYVTYDFVKDEEGEANEYTDVLAEVCPGLSPGVWGALVQAELLCGPRKILLIN